MLKIGYGNAVQLTRGDTAYLNVTITNDVDGTEYEMQDGDVLVFTMKKNVADAPAIQKKIAGGTVFHLEPADTAHLDEGKYKYDVVLTTAAGDVFTVVQASVFELSVEVTSTRKLLGEVT